MKSPRRDATVAVINSSEDTVEMIRQCLEISGYSSVVTGHIHDIKKGDMDFVAYLRKHDPQVIVYDVSIPYDRNWTFLQQLLDLDVMKGRKVVVTTTNKKRLDEIVGPTDAFEIVGKPYDLQELVTIVDRALS